MALHLLPQIKITKKVIRLQADLKDVSSKKDPVIVYRVGTDGTDNQRDSNF